MVEVDEPRNDQQWKTRRCIQLAEDASQWTGNSQGINIHFPVLKSRQKPSLRYLAASSALIFFTTRLAFFTSCAADTTSAGFLSRSVDSSATAGTLGVLEVVGEEETGESAASPRCSLSGMALPSYVSPCRMSTLRDSLERLGDACRAGPVPRHGWALG